MPRDVVTNAFIITDNVMTMDAVENVTRTVSGRSRNRGGLVKNGRRKMQIEILKNLTSEDWMLCKLATLVTVGKDSEKPPSEEFKRNILKYGHSPIRVLTFCFRLTDVPYWVSVHLCRHVHAVPFVKSQRNDRQDEYDRDSAPQDQPVTMLWYMNAEELITIAHKRLCTKAAPETRKVVKQICDLVIETNPEFEGLLVPLCQYRNGVCDEPGTCRVSEKYRARVVWTGKDSTVEIAVPEATYSNAERILLRQENSNYATLYYPDGD